MLIHMSTLLNDVQPQMQTNSIYENEHYLTTKHDDLSVIIGTMNASKILPNSQLTDAHSDGAKLAYAAKVNNEQGRVRAQEYLDANNLNKTITDTSRYHVMVKDRTTGKYTLGGRGMNPLDGQDLINVSKQILGVNESRRIAGEMIEKVGAENVELRGFSMSAADFFDASLDYNVNSILYDAPLNLRHILKNSLATGERSNTIELVRNPENVLSSGTMFRNVSMFPQYEVSVVPTGSSGLVESHKLVPNFTRNQVEDFHQSAVELQRRGTYKAQADTMIDMKKAMNLRETFTEFMRNLSPVDVNGERLGIRVNRNSALVRMWEMLGGDFTESETQHLNTAKTAGEPTENIVDEETIDLIRVDRFDEAEGVAQDIFDQGVSSMEGTDIATHPAVKASMFETLAEQAHPTALGLGLFGAILGGEISNLIDPSGSMGRNDRIGVDLHQAMSGGFGAGFTELGMAGMSGTTALGAEALPVIAAGAIGSVAGTEAQIGVYNALDRAGANTDTKDSISDAVGGAVGGGIFAATSIAGAAAMGAEIGAAGGVAGVAVGAGIGLLFGLGAWAVSKMSHHETKKEEAPPPPSYTPPEAIINKKVVTQ
jgi:hypothetical protein